MGWVRIDDNAPHHRKQLQAGPAACWLWVCGLAYCQRMTTDGFIPAEAVPLLGVGNWKKLTGFLVAAGLWRQADGGYQVHDYLSFNATKEQRQEKAAAHRERTARWRERNRDASQTTGSDAAVTRHSESGVTPLPSHSPSQSQSPPPPKERLPSHPRRFDRQHADHLHSFCEFKCLSDAKVAEFSKDLPGGPADPENFNRVLTWAENVRDTWGDKPKVEFEWWKFWEARWKERAGIEPSARMSRTKAVLERFIAGGSDVA